MPSEKTFVFGTCYYERISPKREEFTPETSILNVQLDLEQALKLELALSEAIRKINRYKENAIDGRKAVVNVGVHLWADRIAVSEGRLPKELKKKKDA
jgi:hypothetical protein